MEDLPGKQLTGRSSNFAWKPERGTRFLVFDRAGRSLKGVYESDAFFAFHRIKAWEDRGDVVLDVAGYPDQQTPHADGITYEVTEVGGSLPQALRASVTSSSHRRPIDRRTRYTIRESRSRRRAGTVGPVHVATEM
jgi:carotenoid cleavage dioxygenase-like enzyme